MIGAQSELANLLLRRTLHEKNLGWDSAEVEESR